MNIFGKRNSRPGIFISYRRDDSAGYAGRLFDNLRQHFGKARVFIDITGIAPGVDFVEAIDKAVGSCDVLIAIIGNKWLDSANAAGQSRLNDTKDFVRLEIATALRRNVRVIPVLVQGAAMPGLEVLPDDLAMFSRRQAIEINDSHWDTDVAQLIDAVESALKQVSVEREEVGEIKHNKAPWSIAAIIGIIFLAGGVIAVYLIKPTQPQMPVTVTAPEKRELEKREPEKRAPEKREPTTMPKPQERVKTEKPVEKKVQPRELKVPTVVGQPLEKAEALLIGAGLKLGKTEEKPTADMRPGTVLSQNPAAGSMSRAGGNVGLTVAAAPKPEKPAPAPEGFEVPNLKGKTLGQAKTILDGMGLGLGSVVWKESFEERPGIVLSQDPAAGKQVEKGRLVDLNVAQAPGGRGR